MADFLRSVAYALEHHFGALCGIALAIYLTIAYASGELKDFFGFLREMLSGPDGRASTKSVGYFMGAATLCWSFAKITLATCRKIDSGSFDPSMVFVADLGVIATLVGVMYLGGKAIAAKFTGGDPPADPPKDGAQ